MRNRAIISAVALAAVVVLCASCTSSDSKNPAESIPVSQRFAKVELADVIPVLTLAGTVQSNIEYQLTAPVAGRLEQAESGELTVTNEATTTVIPLPEGARIVELLVPIGDSVRPGLPVARAVLSGFALVSPVEGADLLRFTTVPVSARSQVDSAGSPFNCELLDPYPSESVGGGSSFVGCLIPADQAAISGMTGLAAFRFAGVVDALSLPVEAVAGTIATGTVFKVKGDSLEEVPVSLGVTDGIRIQILDGLEVGDEVAVPSPSLLNG